MQAPLARRTQVIQHIFTFVSLGVIVRDQCPHCYKKFEQDSWITRQGCPYCGKQIIWEVFEEDPEEKSFFDSLPKVPPKLDWCVIPLSVLLWMPFPYFRWAVTSFNPETFAFGAVSAGRLRLEVALAAGIGGLSSWLFFRAKRKIGDDDRALMILKVKLWLAWGLIALLYLKF